MPCQMSWTGRKICSHLKTVFFFKGDGPEASSRSGKYDAETRERWGGREASCAKVFEGGLLDAFFLQPIEVLMTKA